MKTAPKKRAAEPAPEPAAQDLRVKVEIIITGTAAAGCIHAAGARLTLPKAQADALAALGRGKIIGI